MRVLIVQENGRHDKNRNFRECFSMQRSFQKCGHDADVWGMGHSNYEEGVDYSDYDLLINLENYSHTAGNWLPSFAEVKCPKFLWAIDAHYNGEAMYEREFHDGRYNIMLHSTKDFVTRPYHVWFPNCFDDTLIYPMESVVKEYEFGFCGNYVTEDRKNVLEELEKKYSLKLDIWKIGEDMVRAINSYECSFNYNMDWKKTSALNYRNFETIGCKTLLLTSSSSEYEELGFVDGLNCFIYDSKDDLFDRIDYIRKYDVSDVVDSGYDLSKDHTYDKRVQYLIDLYNVNYS